MANIIINGALGKMGKCIIDTLKRQNYNIIGGIDIYNTSYNKVHIMNSLDNFIDYRLQIFKTNKKTIAIDFTDPECVYENIKTYIKYNIHPIIGTTGLSNEKILKLIQKSEQKKLGGLIAPNFSIGAIMMQSAAKNISEHFDNVQIIEYHHMEKKDSPSGTSIKMQEILSKDIDIDKSDIVSVRLPGILANQDVIFGNNGETLSFA